MFEKATAFSILAVMGILGTAHAAAGNIGADPVNAVLQFGAFGVLCMLILHVFRHTIPRLATGYETNLKEERESNVKQLVQARADYKETLTGQRKDFIDEMRLERASNDHKLEELTRSMQELTRQVIKLVGRATNPKGE